MRSFRLITAIYLLFCMSFIVHAQEETYIVKLRDKSNSPFSIDSPEEFLSDKAIERRRKHNIAIDEFDLPINPFYKQTITELGYSISHSIKWINTLIVHGNSDQELLNLSFVESVKRTYSYTKEDIIDDEQKSFFKAEYYKNDHPLRSSIKGTNNVYDYGDAEGQIVMLNGHHLHNEGYDGTGITIGVLDAGFDNVAEIGVFNHLFEDGRVLGTKDFVEDKDLLNSMLHSHGRYTLSCMAANEPGLMVGTAPEANYWLIRTEDGRSEYLLEEYYWIDGAEFADSVGVDIINSSLGYNDGFVFPENDHVYADMDGNTTPISIGAGIAVDRGIIVVNSAGNSGDLPWHYISAPADNEKVFTIGGVNGNEEYAYFSSVGPTSDGRIKPDVVAQAEGTTVITGENETLQGNGTSFSSPIIAGMVACVWQLFPNKNNFEIIELIKSHGSLSNNPNDLLGYGIPDFLNIYNASNINDLDKENVKVFPNPFKNQLNIEFDSIKTHISIEISDALGHSIFEKKYMNTKNILIPNLQSLPSQIFFLKITMNGHSITEKIIKI